MKINSINPLLETTEEKLLSTMKHLGIKVQSVVLPPDFNNKRDEKKIIYWLYNNIQSLHTANYELKLKYAND
jgi:hypothetical protein